jgi:hypothetical protein
VKCSNEIQRRVRVRVRVVVLNATFNNISVISWWSVLLVDETGENRLIFVKLTINLIRQFLFLLRRVSLVEQELLTLMEHISSPPVFNGVRVDRSLVLCVVFCRSLFVILSFTF